MSKKVSSPSFCYIAPTDYLKWYCANRPIHLTLAHLVEDNAYRDFYTKESDNGSYIIMDNSCYEFKRPLPAEELIGFGQQIQANAIVLPDYIFEPAEKTILEAKRTAPTLKAAGFDTFFVPQSETGNQEDWIDAYTWAANSNLVDIIGISILGVPNALPNINPAYARVVMMQILIDRGLFNPNKHHHFLGLNAGPALEIPSLLRMGVLDSVDSSGPIWSAITGHRYTIEADSLQTVSKIKMPVQFDLPHTKDADTVARIIHNMVETDCLFTNYDRQQKVWYAQE